MDEAKSDAPAVVQEVDFVGLPAGERIGRYEVLSVLGQGGFGITYLARDAQLGREVAIKEYLPTSLAIRQNGATVLPRSTKVAEDFTWGRDRFVAEGRTLATLHQAPGIVRVFDFLEINGTAYIVMEMLHGDTLEGYLKKHGPLQPPAIERILWPLLDGLEQVHQSGFLHRDIKPANILLNAAGNPTLIDFGASRAAMAGRTTAMTAIFTPGYAAAEQMTSAKQGPWTDIYGLSATLYHAITGKAPPNAFERMLDDDYQSLGKREPAGFPPGLLAGIDAGLQVRASDRPQSIAGWRSILTMTTPSSDEATKVAPRQRAEPDATIVSRAAVPPSPAPPAMEEPAASVAPTAPAAKVAAKNRLPLYAGLAAAIVLLAGGRYFVLGSKSGPQATALQDMKVEELEKVLEARRKADAEAADKRRLEEEAQKKATDEAVTKQAADTALGKAQAERQKAETELARLKAELEVQKKAVADRQGAAEEQARRGAAEEAQRKVEAEMAALRQTEEDARKKVAEEGEAKRRADEALVRAQAERQKADAEAARQTDEETKKKAEADAKTRAEAETKAKADADARQKAEAEVAEKKAKAEAEAADKKAAELAEGGLRLAVTDRQRIQVALTSQGFDTRGSDGAFGPRSREMIAGWQKARNQPATGFVSAAQRDELLRSAAPAIARWEDEQKKAEEQKKLDEEKKKADEAKAAAAAAVAAKPTAPTPSPAPTPAPSPPPAAAAAAGSAGTSAVVDGFYSGGMNSPIKSGPAGNTGIFRLTLDVVNGRGAGTVAVGSSAGGVISEPGSVSIAISPDGGVSGSGQIGSLHGTMIKFSVAGRAEGRIIKLDFTGFDRPASMTLSRTNR